MHFPRRASSLAVAGAVLAFAASARAQTVTNGGFETPDINDNFQYDPDGAGTEFGPGAGVTDPPSGFSGLAPTEGSQYAFLQSTSINLTATGLTAGLASTLSFDLTARNCCGDTVEEVTVAIDGGAAVAATTTTVEQFTTVNIPFTPTGTSSTITFSAIDAAEDDTAFIDNVRVTQVPEPAAIGLAGIGGLALLARRRSRR